jgi:hypothetical protein
MFTCIASRCSHCRIGVGVMQRWPVEFVRTERSLSPLEQINWTRVGQQPIDECPAEYTVGGASNDFDSVRRRRIGASWLPNLKQELVKETWLHVLWLWIWIYSVCVSFWTDSKLVVFLSESCSTSPIYNLALFSWRVEQLISNLL